MSVEARHPDRWDVYLSFVGEDRKLVERLGGALEERGKLVFSESPSEDALLESDAVVPIASPTAVSSEGWREELRRAREEGMPVVPVLHRDLGDAERPEELRGLPWVDLRDESDFEKGVEELVAALDSTPPVQEPATSEPSTRAGEDEAAGETVVLHFLRDQESTPFDIPCTPDAARVLLRGARFGALRAERFDLSFTALLLALLVRETRLGSWFRRYADEGGLDARVLLERGNLGDWEAFRTVAGETLSEEPPSAPLLITASTNNLLRRAQELRDATCPEGHVGALDVRHLMGAFIYNETFHVSDWQAMEMDRLGWSNVFLWQIWKNHLHEVEAWKEEHRKTFHEEPNIPEGPSTHIATDVWTTKDALGYEAYAYAIYRFIVHGQTRPPLTISVQAPWGGGKTSLMRMIQKELDPDAERDVGEERWKPRGLLTVSHLLEEIEGWIKDDTQGGLPRIAEGVQPRLIAAWHATLDGHGDEERKRRSRRSTATIREAYNAVRAQARRIEFWVRANGTKPLHGPEAPEAPELVLLVDWGESLARIGRRQDGDPLPRTVEETFDAVMAKLEEMEPWKRAHGSKPLPPPGAVPERLTVWFNAWKYEDTNQVWAGLADAIIQQVAARLPVLERERFWLRLNFKRIDAGKVRFAVHDRIFAHFWERFRTWAVAAAGLAALGLAAIAAGAGIGGLPSWLVPTGGAGVASSTLGGVLVGWWKLWRSSADVKDEPATVSLSSFLGVPDYRSELGFVHHVEADLQRVFDAVPREYFPIVVFVDDLDRCSPTKVAQVVEAVNLFLAGEFPHCIFVLGMDTEMVAAALQAAHEDVIAHLPEDAGTPVGWKFMDKFVQLPFLIPPAEDRALRRYTETLFRTDGSGRRAAAPGEAAATSGATGPRPTEPGAEPGEETPPAPTTEPAGEGGDAGAAAAVGGHTTGRDRLEDLRGRIDSEIEKFSDHNPEIRNLVAEAAAHFKGNPRELKRFVNVFRLNYFLWAVRRSQELEVPTLSQLVRWSIFSMRWPEVVRWLRRGGQGEWEPVEGATAERERDGEFVTRLALIERIADEVDDLEAWQDEVVTRFRLGGGAPRWLADDDLWAFMRERRTETEDSLRLSDGVGKGLW